MLSKKPFLFGILFILLMNSCKKDSDDSACNDPYCPDIFTCKIDGEAWSIKSSTGSCRDMTTNYYPEGISDLKKGALTMAAKNCKSDFFDAIYLSIDSVLSPVKIDLKDTNGIRVYPTRVDDRQFEYPLDEYNQIVDGEVNITLIQADNYGGKTTPKGRVKGTFWITLYNAVNDTIRITDGKFDVSLP